ncbi:hypothetical protein IDT06_000951 [Escherichia coli]|nr:hypothetical protein [Escherichia coli]
MLKRKKVKPITLRDVTIIDDGKLRKAITAASLGNAMEWFDFGVYSAAIFLIPICISFDTAEKRRYATYLILNRRFSFEF